MEKRLVRRAVVTVAAAVTVGVSSPACASVTAPALPAASSPGWRITQTVANLTVGGLWAGGARDAWLAGDACADPATCGVSDTSNGTVVVRHWDGKAWRAVTPPRAYINSPLDQGAGPVVATSASNAWIFAGRGTESVDYTDALHWTGKGWAQPVRLNTAIEAAVAPSAADIWAFGAPERYPQTGYVTHYNGKTWAHGSFPLDGTATSALSPDDIWVGGSVRSTPGLLGIEHWNGHSWRATALPKLGKGQPCQGFLVGITAVTAREAWADAIVLDNTTGQPRSYLLHWDGTSWSQTTIPYGATTTSPVVPDGHGGLWLAVDIGTGRQQTSWFCHYSGGQWTKTPTPRTGTQPTGQISVDQIAWIPGTRSVWATGDVFTNDATPILKDGP